MDSSVTVEPVAAFGRVRGPDYGFLTTMSRKDDHVISIRSRA